MYDHEEDFHSDDDVMIALPTGRSAYTSDEEGHDIGYLDIREADSPSPERRTSSSGYSSHYLDSTNRSLGSGTKTTLLSSRSVSVPSDTSDSPRQDISGGRKGILRNYNRVSFSPVIDARFECMSTENSATREEKVKDMYLRPPVYVPSSGCTSDEEETSIECIYDNQYQPSLNEKNFGGSTSNLSASKSVAVAKDNRPASAEKLLARRQFHKGNFVRYRYPAQFHQTKIKKGQKQIQLPASLQPTTRYGKEPKVQKDRVKRKGKAQWPEPPRYPPKARHTETQCEIIKMVEKLEIGTQSTPEITETGCQAVARTKDAGIQYPRAKLKDIGCQTTDKKVKHRGIQNVATRTNKMVETSTRILYYPEINTRHNWSQTDEVCLACSCGKNSETQRVDNGGQAKVAEISVETIKSEGAAMTKARPKLKRSKSTVDDDEEDGGWREDPQSVSVDFRPGTITGSLREGPEGNEKEESESDLDSPRCVLSDNTDDSSSNSD